jgi:hypothetical protein
LWRRTSICSPLEDTLATAPKGLLRRTILLDPIREDTPKRMAEYVKRHPGQIVAIRIHCNRRIDEVPITSGSSDHPTFARECPADVTRLTTSTA